MFKMDFTCVILESANIWKKVDFLEFLPSIFHIYCIIYLPSSIIYNTTGYYVNVT